MFLTKHSDKYLSIGRQFKSSVKQRGVALAMFAIGGVVLVGMAGLALDMGYAYVNKTRIQNAVDASALAAAKAVGDERANRTPTELATLDLNAAATAAAVNYFNNNNFTLTTDGNSQTVNGNNITVTLHSAIYTKDSEDNDVVLPSSINGPFVRVDIDGANVSWSNWLVRVLPGVGDSLSVAASAVAGPSPELSTLVCDNVLPIMLCVADANGSGSIDDELADKEADVDNSDFTIYGYNVTEQINLKVLPSNPTDIAPGNFRLIRLNGSPGAQDVRDFFAGKYDECSGDGSIVTEPGQDMNPVAFGLNTRFGVYGGPLSQGDDQNLYRPDLNTCYKNSFTPSVFYSLTNYTSPTYAPYDNAAQDACIANSNLDATYSVNGNVNDYARVPGRRFATIPIGNCQAVIDNGGGSVSVPLVDYLCLFLTKPAKTTGSPAERGIFAQIFGSGCGLGDGSFGPPDSDNGTLGGTGNSPYKLIIYHDPLSRDS